MTVRGQYHSGVDREEEARIAVSPLLRIVIENPSGAFQKWKRGDISYVRMCGDLSMELDEARKSTHVIRGREGSLH